MSTQGYGDRLSGGSSVIKFGGLNSRTNPLEIDSRQTPFARNVVSFPVGSVRSRNGFQVLKKGDGITDDTPGDIVEPAVGIDGLALLPRISDSEAYLIASRDGQLWQRSLSGGGEWFDTEFPVVGTDLNYAIGRLYVGNGDAVVGSGDRDGTYYDAVAFCCTGGDEPFVITGQAEADFWENEAVVIDELTGASLGNPVSIKITAHGLTSGDVVRFTGITAANWTAINDITFRIERIDADKFYLLTSSLARLTATGGAWSTFALPVGTAKTSMLGVLRWPKGKYAIDGTRAYGYPDRWDDPDDDSSLPWGTGDAASWPSAISVFGEGLMMRAFAYGFSDDQSRVDVSMLGEPSNFLKVDVDAADEASATDSDEDGGYFYVSRGDGDMVTGAAKMFDLYIFTKKRCLTIWGGEFGSSSNPMHIKATIPVGNANPKSIGMVGNELFFWDPIHGPKRLRAVQEYGDLAPGDLGDDIPVEIAEVTAGTEDQIRFVHDRANRCVMWFACVGGASVCNRVFVYYYLSNEWQVWDGLYAECSNVVASLGAADDGASIYAARETGEVVLLNTGYSDGLDQPITSSYRTKWFPAPDISHGARPIFADVVYGDLGPGDSQMTIRYDFSDQPEFTAEPESSFGEQAAGYDHGIYDEGFYDVSSPMLMRYNLAGDGSMYQIVVSSDSTVPWQIHLISMEIAVRGKRK